MNRVSATTACLISLLLITGCAHRATPEEVRASELAARASRSAAAADSIPAAVTSRTKSACENDLRSLASKSSGKYVHTVESVEFLGDVSEYNLRNRPHAYDIVVSYTVRMAASGELVKSKGTCRVNDSGSVEWMAA
jgi:hypothetical protein